MTIDLNSTVGSCSRYVFGSDLLNGILSSSVTVAVLISLVMVLLIMVMYPAKKGTGFAVIAKMGLYMFFLTMLIVFLHDSVLKFIFNEKSYQDSSEDIMRGVNSYSRDPVASSVYTSVTPDMVSNAAPSDTPIIPISGGDDSTDREPEPEPAYSGSIVNGGNHGILGGGKVPSLTSNPYT
jgi:hypothetical protein